MTHTALARARLRLVAIVATALTFSALAALTGCASYGKPSDNKDPREGRVTTEWSNCETGDCLWSWKVCIGADLIVHVDGVKPDHTIRDARECAA